jgi:hypothetical protein
MNIPVGFTFEHGNVVFSRSSNTAAAKNYVLRLKKNMYSLRQVGNNWFDALCASLLSRGFCHSTNDPCLFIKHDCILLVYVHDCLLFAKSDDVLDSILASLEMGFSIISQGSVGA